MKDKNAQHIRFDIEPYGGSENESYVRSHSDQHISTTKEGDRLTLKQLPRISSAGASTFPVIYEGVAATNNSNSTRDVSCPSPTWYLPTSAPPTIHNQQMNKRATILGSLDRQLSLLDPMSDRVSTILVWQNLIVSTREDKKSQLVQRMKLSKNAAPKKKVLLHNISGAITGGLWAVMGTFFRSINNMNYNYLVSIQVHLVLASLLF